MQLPWKPNWPQTRSRFMQWWDGKGLLVGAWGPGIPRASDPADGPPPAPADVRQRWTDPAYRSAGNEYLLSRQYYGLDVLPVANADLGPGSLALVLGARPDFTDETVWYHPSGLDPETDLLLRFDEHDPWWMAHREILQANLQRSAGRYFVGMPDLVENLDVLASLRGTETVLTDLVAYPEWVKDKLLEINEAYFQVYDRLYDLLQGATEGMCFHAFRLWAPGRAAKVQCDLSAMISPAMFRAFVQPVLRDQCRRLDYSMYHLDGSGAQCHLDSLLEIDELHAIEWTPEPSQPNGGDPCWFDMYRRIKQAGKAVQVVRMRPEQIVPVIEAVGPEGMYLVSHLESPAQMDALQVELEQYGY